MHLSNVFLEIKVSAEAFIANVARIWFFLTMSMHMEGQVVGLMKGFITQGAFVLFVIAVSQFVVLIVALLMKSFSAYLACKRFYAYKTK